MEAIQELSERKTKILHAIIKNYLETGEPVGSRTISKYTDLKMMYFLLSGTTLFLSANFGIRLF